MQQCQSWVASGGRKCRSCAHRPRARRAESGGTGQEIVRHSSCVGPALQVVATASSLSRRHAASVVPSVREDDLDLALVLFLTHTACDTTRLVVGTEKQRQCPKSGAARPLGNRPQCCGHDLRELESEQNPRSAAHCQSDLVAPSCGANTPRQVVVFPCRPDGSRS